jgi:hypothetical protein
MLTSGRIDPLDPEASEHSLLHFAIAVGVLTRFRDRLLGNAEDSATRRSNLSLLLKFSCGDDAPSLHA